MSKTTDFTSYKQQAYLELCLSLVKEACADLEKGHFDLAEEQLRDILDTFDRAGVREDSQIAINKTPHTDNVLAFPQVKRDSE